MLDPAVVRDLRFSLSDPLYLCNELGLLSGKFLRQSRGVIVRCPWHDEKTPSCSVRLADDGTIATKCHGCGVGGDALSLIAAVHSFDMKQDFPKVLEEAARLAGVSLEKPTAAPSRPPPPPVPDRGYPPDAAAFWDRCTLITDADGNAIDPDVVAWVKSRGLDPIHVDGAEVVRALPLEGDLPRWASYRGQSWRETGHKLIVAMYDEKGVLRSVRGCRVTDGDSPKRLPPGGHRASGLVMACPLAQAMLAGTWKPERVVISEGEPDFLVWASRTGIAACARLGIVSGSWTDKLAARVPSGVKVAVRTDSDEAGDRYAREVWRTLKDRCAVSRVSRAAS